MPRALRSDQAGVIYHALNRGNARNDIFFKNADYEAFERVIACVSPVLVDTGGRLIIRLGGSHVKQEEAETSYVFGGI